MRLLTNVLMAHAVLHLLMYISVPPCLLVAVEDCNCGHRLLADCGHSLTAHYVTSTAPASRGMVEVITSDQCTATYQPHLGAL